MIFDALIFIVTSWLALVVLVLGGIQSVFHVTFPIEFQQYLTQFLSYTGYFTGVFPVATFFQAVLLYLGFYVSFYLVKVVFLGYAVVPWFGKQVDLPNMDKHKKVL